MWHSQGKTTVWTRVALGGARPDLCALAPNTFQAPAALRHPSCLHSDVTSTCPPPGWQGGGWHGAPLRTSDSKRALCKVKRGKGVNKHGSSNLVKPLSSIFRTDSQLCVHISPVVRNDDSFKSMLKNIYDLLFQIKHWTDNELLLTKKPHSDF